MATRLSPQLTNNTRVATRLAPHKHASSIPITSAAPTFVTDASGTVVQTLDYYPFGATRISSSVGGANSARKYGDQFSDDSSLDYFNARYYDPSRGQFLSEDPQFKALGTSELDKLSRGQEVLSNPQELNSYSYALNNPIRNVDTTGNASVSAYALNPILTALQVVLIKLSATLYDMAHSQSSSMTSTFFSRSADIDPKPVQATPTNNYSYITNAVKLSPEYNSFMQRVVKDANKSGKNEFDHKYAGGDSGDSINFTFGDLYTSIGGTLSTDVSGIKEKNGRAFNAPKEDLEKTILEKGP
jgi:RHS repeat-associated protein